MDCCPHKGPEAVWEAIKAGPVELRRFIETETCAACAPARLTWRDVIGWTPLHFAADWGDTSLVELMFLHYPGLGGVSFYTHMSPLCCAALNRDLRMVVLLVDRMAVHPKSMRYALLGGDLDVVKLVAFKSARVPRSFVPTDPRNPAEQYMARHRVRQTLLVFTSVVMVPRLGVRSPLPILFSCRDMVKHFATFL